MQPAFWAKTVRDDQPGITVLDHMLNVGHVAQCLAHARGELLDLFQIDSTQIAALAALHDLGKISPGFQRKCAAWLKANNLSDLAQRCKWDRDMEPDHGQVTHAAVQALLGQVGAGRRPAKYLSAILGGHHGRIQWPSDRGFQPRKAISEQHSGIDWAKARNDSALAVCNAFGADLANITVDADSPALWWLAGLTSVADWIGSDERFFSPEHGTATADAAENAQEAGKAIGLFTPEINAGLSFHDLFHDPRAPNAPFTPNDMQLRAMSTITGPGVYVVEGPMGTGKTEAALGAAYQLLVEKKARGVYFALPTQATSNRMHVRMAEFVRRIAPDPPGYAAGFGLTCTECGHEGWPRYDGSTARGATGRTPHWRTLPLAGPFFRVYPRPCMWAERFPAGRSARISALAATR